MVYWKQIDWRDFLHYTSAHPRTLIKSLLCSQALHLKKICTEMSELRICKTLLNVEQIII